MGVVRGVCLTVGMVTTATNRLSVVESGRGLGVTAGVVTAATKRSTDDGVSPVRSITTGGSWSASVSKDRFAKFRGVVGSGTTLSASDAEVVPGASGRCEVDEDVGTELSVGG